MSHDVPDALGLTFEQLEVAAQTKLAMRPTLREWYGNIMNGEAVNNVEPWQAGFSFEPLPVKRHHREGELIKFVQQRPDGLETESVVIPMSRGTSRWTTLCVSSQIGCAMGCTFCETAQLGLLKNLPASQIVGQIVAARRAFGAEVRNVVFMGMGEPFDNFDEVTQAVRVLGDPRGLSMGKSRITISTVGRIDGIRRLASLGWRRLNLAVSLNAPNDAIRSQIMPINRAEPMAELRQALLDYPLRTCQFFMIEYVLIPGVNDAHEHARELADYLRPLKCCVNLIPYNPRRNSPWPAPDPDSVQQFLQWLQDERQFCKLRITKGRDFMAACGQLGNRALSRRTNNDTSMPLLPIPISGTDQGLATVTLAEKSI